MNASAAPPRIRGLLESSLYVDDPARSAAFYRDLFGFRTVVDSPRLIALEAGPAQVLLLFRKGESARLPVGPHDGSGELHLAFAIEAAQLEAWRNRLRTAGLTIEDEKTWDGGGRSIYFRDPDRHLLELVTPGTWHGTY